VVREHFWGLDRRGFSALELIVVVAIIGTVTAISIPSLVNYYQASTLKAGAGELATALNQARQLAISQNRNVCFAVGANNQYQYLLGGCAGTIWVGPGSANGVYRLTGNVLLTTDFNPVFNYLGAATAGTLTVRYITQSGTQGTALNVAVSASGRIQIQAAP
jgi:prepilin-type N-terminal cleavage/methylation domain-containing protein